MTDSSCYAETKASLLRCVESGLLELVGADEDGEPLFRLTEEGRRYVEAMPLTKMIKEGTHPS